MAIRMPRIINAKPILRRSSSSAANVPKGYFAVYRVNPSKYCGRIEPKRRYRRNPQISPQNPRNDKPMEEEDEDDDGGDDDVDDLVGDNKPRVFSQYPQG
ncbi:hypothetical protein LguiA_009063 [Lonicera macranthoides]